MTNPYNQSNYEICCEWGLQGVHQLAPSSDVVIIVDVLSFSICVSVACELGASVFPFSGTQAAAIDFARNHAAILAVKSGQGAFSLLPASLPVDGAYRDTSHSGIIDD